MTIEKHGNKWRITEMHDGIRYRISVDDKPTKKEALELLRQKIDTASPSKDPKDTFSISARKYIDIKYNVLSPSTIRSYYTILNSLSDRFRKTKTNNITPELVQKEINDYSATHSAKSTSNMYGFISSVLGLYRPALTLNPTLPQKVKYEAFTPTEDHIKTLLTAVKGTDYEIAFRLGVYGLRRGEVCAITSADLDGNLLSINKSKILNEDSHWVIKPFPKTTSSQRVIYIDTYLADLIRKQGVAFPYEPNWLTHQFKAILKRLGLPHFRFHDLRAYYASMAHSLGVPDVYIMANGGWSSPNILNRVYKRAMEDKQNEVNKAIADHLAF